MKELRIMSIVFLCAFSYTVSCQVVYSEVDQKMFVKVYLEEKTVNSDLRNSYESQIETILADAEIDDARFSEIYKAKLTGADVNFSIEEDEMLQRLAELKRKSIIELNAITEQITLHHGLDFITYKAYKKKYRNDIDFQRSLKPLFEKYLIDSK